MEENVNNKKYQSIKTGYIYLITNKITGKHYVGQSQQRNPLNRWAQHYRNAFYQHKDTYLYRSMRKCGIENFTFQIIEANIRLEDLNDRQKFYIAKYNAYHDGYNGTLGGQEGTRTVDISEEEVLEIVDEIREGNKTFSEIGEEHNITANYVACINIGRTWYFDGLVYPISSRLTKANFSSDQIQEIYKQLKNPNIQIIEIANRYNISTSGVYRINIGASYHQENTNYPIRIVIKRRRLDLETVGLVVNLLQKQNYTYQEIGDALGLSYKQVFSLNYGKSYKDLFAQLGITEFPIRNFTLRGKRPRVKNHTKSGVWGVRWNKQVGKWQAEITINKKRTILGYYNNKNDAIQARKQAEKIRQQEDPMWDIPNKS